MKCILRRFGSMGKRGPDKQKRKSKTPKPKVAPTIDGFLYERLYRIALKINGDTPPPEPGTVNKKWIGAKAVGEELILAGLEDFHVMNEVGEYFVYNLRCEGLPELDGDESRASYKVGDGGGLSKRLDMKFTPNKRKQINSVKRALDSSLSAACELLIKTAIDTSSSYKAAMRVLEERKARHS
jgi:hypothetical protein